MPIVVDEVVISVDVNNEGAADRRALPGRGTSEMERQQIVNECVERVLEILAEREER